MAYLNLSKGHSVAIASVGAILVGTALSTSAQAQSAISGYTTGGADMDGMQVLVEFLDGSTEEAIWGTTAANAGGAFGTDWDLTFSGSTTFGSPWTFNAGGALSVSSLTINGIPGNTAFDDGAFPSTPGSASGWAFETASGQAPDSWEYSNPLDISTGDMWGTLAMSWDNGFSGTMTFIADTDNGTVDNPLTAAHVPEPTTVLGLVGVAAAFGMSKARKRQQSS
ncbi:MAG: PEP-CTERM sorting domain-containing protein [Cyanobacteria bacterium P01_H01_bin.119]